MKERPILFSAPMVRALLAGTKTQTRRAAPVCKLGIHELGDGLLAWTVSFSKPIKGVHASHSGGRFTADQARRIIASQFCPYGQPGDRLWVREAWGYFGGNEYLYQQEKGSVCYRADAIEGLDHVPGGRWRPSIHMPRWASRIALKITGVRVERLHEISEADAQAEGCEPNRMPQHPDMTPYRAGYSLLWDGINGAGSWDINPWVWCVEFKLATLNAQGQRAADRPSAAPQSSAPTED